MSPSVCPWTPQLPQNFPADTGCLRDKAAVPGDMLEEVPCIIVLIRNWYVWRFRLPICNNIMTWAFFKLNRIQKWNKTKQWQSLFYRVFLSSFNETQLHYCAENVHWSVHVFVTPVKFGETVKEVICTVVSELWTIIEQKLKELTGAYWQNWKQKQ
jgi:hypothetical protein